LTRGGGGYVKNKTQFLLEGTGDAREKEGERGGGKKY